MAYYSIIRETVICRTTLIGFSCMSLLTVISFQDKFYLAADFDTAVLIYIWFLFLKDLLFSSSGPESVNNLTLLIKEASMMGLSC